ncbi:TPA: hypothetical protein HA225_01395 [Candidatus Micrarchaeota archaeon]|nr:hypothetical protein [Candidatus Micrarchaeota archaeon]
MSIKYTRDEEALTQFKKIFEKLDELLYKKLATIPSATGTMHKDILDQYIRAVDAAESSLYISLILSFYSSFENTHKNYPAKLSDKEWAQIEPMTSSPT